MQWTPNTCPECGAPACSVEVIATRSVFQPAGDGPYEYVLDDEIHWETCEPVLQDGKHTLVCETGHTWQAVPQASG